MRTVGQQQESSLQRRADLAHGVNEIALAFGQRVRERADVVDEG
jgi:hypothetical protein